MNVYEKWLEVKKHVDYLKKESNGPQYQYVGSSQVLGSIRGKMNDLGLILLTKITGHNVREHIKADKGTVTYFTELDILYTLVNVEKPAETIDFTFYGQGVDTAGEKGVGKALTYAEKYFFLKELNIPTDKDDPDSFQAKYEDNSNGKKPRQNERGEAKQPLEITMADYEKAKPIQPTTLAKDMICSGCKDPIDTAVNAYSIKTFGRALCRNCQKKQRQGAK